MNTYRHNKVITQKSYHNALAIHIPNNSKSIFLKRNTITIKSVNWGNKNNDCYCFYHLLSLLTDYQIVINTLLPNETPKMKTECELIKIIMWVNRPY